MFVSNLKIIEKVSATYKCQPKLWIFIEKNEDIKYYYFFFIKKAVNKKWTEINLKTFPKKPVFEEK